LDPLTLFALASGAVQAVKKGCQLYKDIKGAAGDIKGVLKDLDDQFHNAYAAKGKSPSPEAKKQFIEEKARVKELNKRSEESNNIYADIGDYLGQYYDNYYKCLAVFEEEERRSKNEIYTGDASLGKRALQRVLMKKQLEQMGTELRELMIYQSPPELGALFTDVEDMMKKLGKEQKFLITKHLQIEQAAARRRARDLEKLKHKLYYVGAVIVIVIFWAVCMYFVVENRKKEFPELGDDWLPHRISDYDIIITERNKKYWAEKDREYRNRYNRR
jgi:hypothetical protein